MKDKITSLVIDLSGLDDSMYANMSSFPITFYRFTNGIHEVQLRKDNAELLSNFLTLNNVPYKRIGNDNDDFGIFIKIFVESDVYLDPNHHVELRVRNILTDYIK